MPPLSAVKPETCVQVYCYAQAESTLAQVVAIPVFVSRGSEVRENTAVEWCDMCVREEVCLTR